MKKPDQLSTFDPYTTQDLFDVFSAAKGSINKHLLIIYSLAIGVNAQRIIELGIGSTTRTLRAAALQTGGKVFSCDLDRQRFSRLLTNVTPEWSLQLSSSTEFLKNIVAPLDFVVHDAAHDYGQVKMDLELIFPMMRQFGLVCIHDTQHNILGKEMILAIKDASKNAQISFVSLPFQYGLTILRIEQSQYKTIPPAWTDQEGCITECISTPLSFNSDFGVSAMAKAKIWLKWKLRPMRNKFKIIFHRK
jgi:hypothetical protein